MKHVIVKSAVLNKTQFTTSNLTDLVAADNEPSYAIKVEIDGVDRHLRLPVETPSLKVWLEDLFKEKVRVQFPVTAYANMVFVSINQTEDGGYRVHFKPEPFNPINFVCGTAEPVSFDFKSIGEIEDSFMASSSYGIIGERAFSVTNVASLHRAIAGLRKGKKTIVIDKASRLRGSWFKLTYRVHTNGEYESEPFHVRVDSSRYSSLFAYFSELMGCKPNIEFSYKSDYTGYQVVLLGCMMEDGKPFLHFDFRDSFCNWVYGIPAGFKGGFCVPQEEGAACQSLPTAQNFVFDHDVDWTKPIELKFAMSGATKAIMVRRVN